MLWTGPRTGDPLTIVEYKASFYDKLFRLFYRLPLLVRDGDAEGVRVQDGEDFVLSYAEKEEKRYSAR